MGAQRAVGLVCSCPRGVAGWAGQGLAVGGPRSHVSEPHLVPARMRSRQAPLQGEGGPEAAPQKWGTRSGGPSACPARGGAWGSGAETREAHEPVAPRGRRLRPADGEREGAAPPPYEGHRSPRGGVTPSLSQGVGHRVGGCSLVGGGAAAGSTGNRGPGSEAAGPGRSRRRTEQSRGHINRFLTPQLLEIPLRSLLLSSFL